MWSAAIILSLITVPAVSLETLSMLSHGDGICAIRARFPLDRKTISFVFEQSGSKLCLSAQSLICASSALHDPLLAAGMIK